jgi:hypothetical protein
LLDGRVKPGHGEKVMAFDSLDMLAACVLFAASVGAWALSAPLRPRTRLYVRFSAMLFAALAVSAPLGMADIVSLFLLPLSAVSLMIAALARFARPLPVFAASLALIVGLAGGLGALLSGATMLALAPVVFAGLAIIAAALNGAVIIPMLAGTALLGSGLVFLEQGAGAGLFLFCAAALVGLARSASGEKKSALAVEQQRLTRRGAAVSGFH